MITRNTYIEDLIQMLPEAVTYLSQKNIRCVVCGEPIWGTLEQAAREKGYTDADIDRFVKELNAMLKKVRKAAN
ncbi:MAG: DUF1858 domain-containing protein [Calditrichaeota bacterium]|nr:MAG: DUF1858 domain-containing protein [Calditrichota bacterium]